MPRLGAAVVVDLSIHINAPARHNMWMPIGTDGTKPIMFGFGQLLRDPFPGHERDRLVHVSFGKIWSGNLYRFHVPHYKAISANLQSIERRGRYPFAGPFLGGKKSCPPQAELIAAKSYRISAENIHNIMLTGKEGRK